MLINRKSLSFIITVLSFIGTLPILANDKTQQESFATYITNKYLTTLFGEEKIVEIKPIDENSLSFIEKIKYNINKPYNTQKQLLTPRETQKIAFDLVTIKSNFATTIFDKLCLEKLEIITTNANQQSSLLNILFNHIYTKIGKAYAAFTLCHPTNDIALLQNRQQAIKYISSHQKLMDNYHRSFKIIAHNENLSLQTWHAKLSINEAVLKTFYFSWLKPLNTNTIALEAYNRGMSSLSLINGTIGIPVMTIAAYYTIFNYFGQKITFKEAAQYYWNRLVSPKIPLSLKLAENYGLLFQPISAYQATMSLKCTNEVSNHLQAELIATANHVTQLKILSSFVNKNKQLVELLPTLKPLAEFNNPKKHSAALNKLLGMLETNTFKGEPSFWSITGRVLAAHKLMHQVKDELAPVFAAAGELEMYVALAQLYAEQQGENATWCMANFVESETPVIEAQDFWNPFINPDIVVTNDVTFDAQHPNSILTGPNTGGKSTVIKGVMLNVLMAQTFGIASARSFTFTPFAKLNCFMNIADDIATGASLFKSEVMRAKELSAMIQNLKENEFSFVIIDEVFTGTSPVEGEQAALRFAKHLTTFPNSIAVIATHYPKMTTLEAETNGKFYNHHVEIVRNEDGSLNRTFKLKNGPTFFNVAFDILEEEGLCI